MQRQGWLVTAMAVVGLALGLTAGGALAASRPSCGTVVVGPAGAAAFYSVNKVSARGASCASARGLVRAWARAAQLNQLPARVVQATDSHGVLVWGRPGAPYRFHGHTCRWTNTKPNGSGYQPGRGRCQAGSTVIAWTYNGADNPSYGGYTGCQQGFAWKHGVVSVLRVRAISCARARPIVSGALNHGLLRHLGGRLLIARRKWDGFTFDIGGDRISARRGRARMGFDACWYNVTC